MTVGELRDRLVDVPEDYEIETSDNQRVVDLKAHEGVNLVILELLGSLSVRTTELHYSPWVKSRWDALEKAVKAV